MSVSASPLPGLQGYNAMPSFCEEGSGDETQVFMLARATFYYWSHFPAMHLASNPDRLLQLCTPFRNFTIISFGVAKLTLELKK